MIDTKPNLSDNKFEQCTGDALALSGDTNIFGQLEIQDSATLSIRPNRGAGKVLTSDVDGFATWQEPSGSASSTSQVSKLISQASHGFNVGEVVGWSSGQYTLPIADGTYDGEVLGIVSRCYNADCFDLTQAGYVTGLTGLVTNSTYFLSPTTPGLLTSDEPSGNTQISKAVLIATASDTAWVLPYPGYIITTGSTGGGGGTITGGTNGLGTDGANIILGGELLQGTSIGINSGDFSITGNTNGTIFGLCVTPSTVILGDYNYAGNCFIVLDTSSNPYIDLYVCDVNNTLNASELRLSPSDGYAHIYQDCNSGNEYGCVGVLYNCPIMSSNESTNSCSTCLQLTPTKFDVCDLNGNTYISMETCSVYPYIDMYVCDENSNGAELYLDPTNGQSYLYQDSDGAMRYGCVGMAGYCSVMSSMDGNNNCQLTLIVTPSGATFNYDCSANYTALSIPTVGWVTGQTGGGITASGNGLSDDGTTVVFGGTLTGDTCIGVVTNCICIVDSTEYGLTVDGVGSTVYIGDRTLSDSHIQVSPTIVALQTPLNGNYINLDTAGVDINDGVNGNSITLLSTGILITDGQALSTILMDNAGVAINDNANTNSIVSSSLGVAIADNVNSNSITMNSTGIQFLTNSLCIDLTGIVNICTAPPTPYDGTEDVLLRDISSGEVRVISLSTITGATSGSGGSGIGWSNLTNGSTVAGCGSLPTGSTATTCCNTLFGVNAGQNISTGYMHIAIGTNALCAETTGLGNIAIGYQALCGANNTYSSIGIGNNVLSNSSSMSNNIGIGNNALSGATSVDNNIAIGESALYCNISGNENTAIGHYALRNNTTGRLNVVIGNCTMQNNATGEENVAIGYGALGSNINGWDNIAIGSSAMAQNCGSKNIAIGCGTMWQSYTGSGNTMIGDYAGGTIEGCYNVMIGNCAGNWEIGTVNNKLHIANNANCTLIYGEFDNNLVCINGELALGVVSGGTCDDSILVLSNNYLSVNKIRKVPYVSGSTSSSLSEFTITGDSSTTGFTVNHGLNKQFVMTEVVKNVSPYPTIYTSVSRPNANCVCITFDTAPANGLEYKILILK